MQWQQFQAMVQEFINLVAEKLSALRTESYFQERAARANPEDFLRILDKAGSEAPRAGDELP